MALGRPKVALILTDDERVRLDSLAHRSRTAPHLARRARIVLACAEGQDNKAVAKRLRMSQTTVCKWRGRFVRERVDGLYDEPRPGAPRQISDEHIERVIVRTLEETPRGETHWSSRGMAKASGLGRTTVQQIWRAFGLQPHRTDTFKLSTDPLLIDDVADLVDQQRVGRQLERVGAMRLESERPPDLLDRRTAEATRFGHAAAAPVRLAAGRLLERPHDHSLDVLIADLPRRPGPRLVVQPVDALAHEPSAPLADRGLRHAQSLRHRLVILALRARQHDTRAPREVWSRPRAMRQRVESHAFVVRQNQRDLWASQCHARLLVDEYDRAAPFISHSSRSGH